MRPVGDEEAEAGVAAGDPWKFITVVEEEPPQELVDDYPADDLHPHDGPSPRLHQNAGRQGRWGRRSWPTAVVGQVAGEDVGALRLWASSKA